MDISIRRGSGERPLGRHPALVTTMGSVRINTFLGGQVTPCSEGDRKAELLDEHAGALDGLR